MQHQPQNSDKMRKAPSPDISELEKKVQETTDRVEEVTADHRKHAVSNQELRDYGHLMDFLKRIVEYPKHPGFKPSKIELMVQEVHDKIEAEYKNDWEVYDRVKTAKWEAVKAARDASRCAQSELCVAKR